VSSGPAQMWQRWAQSRRRCGSGGPSPGADVAAVRRPPALSPDPGRATYMHACVHACVHVRAHRHECARADAVRARLSTNIVPPLPVLLVHLPAACPEPPASQLRVPAFVRVCARVCAFGTGRRGTAVRQVGREGRGMRSEERKLPRRTPAHLHPVVSYGKRRKPSVARLAQVGTERCV
jgi:hypothetical protein